MKAIFFFLLLLASLVSAAGNPCTSHDDCPDDEYCGAGGTCVTFDRPGESSCCGPAAILALVCAAAFAADFPR